MTRWVIVLKGIEADRPEQLAMAAARIKAALRLPYEGVVTVEQWLYTEATAGTSTVTGGTST